MQQVTATKAVWHGDPCIETNFAGVAVKNRAPSAAAAAGTPQKQIVVGEQFAIITKGIVQVNAVAGAVVGDAITINAGSNVLTVGTGAPKFGRVVYLAGQQGTPVGKMRVDLDKKDSY
jgi:hypothetical protein